MEDGAREFRCSRSQKTGRLEVLLCRWPAGLHMQVKFVILPFLCYAELWGTYFHNVVASASAFDEGAKEAVILTFCPNSQALPFSLSHDLIAFVCLSQSDHSELSQLQEEGSRSKTISRAIMQWRDELTKNECSVATASLAFFAILIDRLACSKPAKLVRKLHYYAHHYVQSVIELASTTSSHFSRSALYGFHSSLWLSFSIEAEQNHLAD